MEVNTKNDKNLILWQKNNSFPSDDTILNYFNKNYFNIKEIKDYKPPCFRRAFKGEAAEHDR